MGREAGLVWGVWFCTTARLEVLRYRGIRNITEGPHSPPLELGGLPAACWGREGFKGTHPKATSAACV